MEKGKGYQNKKARIIRKRQWRRKLVKGCQDLTLKYKKKPKRGEVQLFLRCRAQ